MNDERFRDLLEAFADGEFDETSSRELRDAFDRMIELLAVNEVTYASSEMSTLHMLGNEVDPQHAPATGR